ncbi:MAG: hypothetical protein WC371_04630 [Parachlamydiales bacterium]|jgi:heme/copper-type cytochrome/quinol oxidase subunit 2
MKKLVVLLVSANLCTAGFSEQKPCAPKTAELASTTAVSLSMMAWGVGLVIAIAVVCALVKNSKA